MRFRQVPLCRYKFKVIFDDIIIFNLGQYDRIHMLLIWRLNSIFMTYMTHIYDTLTNKAVGTIWRALSKSPQRRQGPDLCPLWLLVGTPSAIIPELAFSRAEHSRPYSDVAKYIFGIYMIYYFINYAVCVLIFMTSPLCVAVGLLSI